MKDKGTIEEAMKYIKRREQEFEEILDEFVNELRKDKGYIDLSDFNKLKQKLRNYSQRKELPLKRGSSDTKQLGQDTSPSDTIRQTEEKQK
jgi:endonuclease IV